MKIIANAKWPGFFSRIGEENCRCTAPSIPHLKCRPGTCLENNNRREIALIRRHQPFPRTTESQLNSKGGGEEDVDFPGLDFLQIARGNFSTFCQFVLRQFFAHAFPAHVRAEDLDSLPFFFGNGHDILHRFYAMNMNDTYIVKEYRILLAIADKQQCNRRCHRIQREMACKVFQPLENELAPKKA